MPPPGLQTTAGREPWAGAHHPGTAWLLGKAGLRQSQRWITSLQVKRYAPPEVTGKSNFYKSCPISNIFGELIT